MKKMLLFSILLTTISIGYTQKNLSIGLSFGGNASDANYTNVPNFQGAISNVDETTKLRPGLQGPISAVQ